MPTERKTFTEWQSSYGIALLHVEKEDLITDDGSSLLMTATEFEQRVVGYLERRRTHHGAKGFRSGDEASATLEDSRSRMQDSIRTNRRDETNQIKQPRTAKRRLSIRSMIWLLVLVTFPTLVTLMVSGFVRLFTRFIRVRWQISAAVLLADLIVLLIRPVGALLSGPGYLWYQALNFVYTVSTRGWVMAQHVLFNRSLNFIEANHPLFWSVNAGGSPLPLYFDLSEAVVSSLFWATTLVFAQALFREVRYRSSTRTEQT